MAAGLQVEYHTNATTIYGFEHRFHMIVPAYTSGMVDNDCMSVKKICGYYNNFVWKG